MIRHTGDMLRPTTPLRAWQEWVDQVKRWASEVELAARQGGIELAHRVLDRIKASWGAFAELATLALYLDGVWVSAGQGCAA